MFLQQNLFGVGENLPRNSTTRTLIWETQGGGYKYYYNIKHLAYEALNEDNDAHAEHIFRLLVQAVAEIDLESDAPVLFDEKDVKEPNLVARKVGILLGDSLYEYYKE